MNEEYVCTNRECNWKGFEGDVLKAPNPFEPKEEMFACPDCRDYESLYPACQIDGCWNMAIAGVKTDSGYKRLCRDHYSDQLK